MIGVYKQYEFIFHISLILVYSWQPMFPGDKAKVSEEQVQSQGGTGNDLPQ